MIIPCEVATKTVCPAIRALMAQTLIEKHNMNQIKVAQVLGVTQSAISKYSKKVRGTTIPIGNIPQVHELADQMISLLLAKPVHQTEVMRIFCQACTLIRSQGLMCPLCQQNQGPQIENCSFCNNT